MGAVTVRDIAKILGVSPSTVSRALSDPEKVAVSTREQVQKVAAEIGYRPNHAARGLITGKTGNVGLVVPDIQNPVFAATVKGAQQRARARGYAVLIADFDEDARQETEFVEHLSAQVDGLILASSRMSTLELNAITANIPTIVVNREGTTMSSIAVDGADGMRQAILHLQALGHHRIAYLAGPRDSWSNDVRTAGLRGISSETGIELIELGHTAPTFSGGVASADRVIASGVTAVVCYNDLIALGVLSRLAIRGVKVPEQLSVIGFDGIPEATWGTPTLTTLAVPMQQLGREAVEMLLVAIKRPAEPATERRIVPELVVRGSTGPAINM